MIAALASVQFINRDIAFNLSQMERYMRQAKEEGADLICFGESFLQGFDCLDWNYEQDKTMAVTLDSPEIDRLKNWTLEIGIDVLFGFIEREEESLYSSCALVSEGNLIHRYRRISRGWKEYDVTDGHYREGVDTEPFWYRGRLCQVALCGDMWDWAERFAKGAELLFWPVFVGFSPEVWETEELGEYAKQSLRACPKALLINSVVEDPPAYGGCCYFAGGTVQKQLPMGGEGLLLVQI